MNIYTKIIDKLGENRIRRGELLSKYTSINIGGPADLFFEAETIEDLQKAIHLAKKYKVQFLLLGGGTNLLISDKGYRGLVIRNQASKIQPIKFTGNSIVHSVYIKVDSGVSVNRLVRYTLDEGLSGLEYFLGQPGTVGGAVWINAHNLSAGDKYFSDNITEAEILDINGTKKKVPVSYFKFGYDKSIIQKTNEIVLTVTLALDKREKEDLWKIAQESFAYRKETQPLDYPSSGCSLRNISPDDAKKIGTPKNTTSCGYLIDSLGLKGKRIGGAKFSEKHAAFIINVGNAKASDVKALIDLAKKKIKEKYGVEVMEEVVLVGEF